MIDGHSTGGKDNEKTKMHEKEEREAEREKKQTRQPARPTARPTALPPLPFLRGVCVPLFYFTCTHTALQRERESMTRERERRGETGPAG